MIKYELDAFVNSFLDKTIARHKTNLVCMCISTRSSIYNTWELGVNKEC